MSKLEPIPVYRYHDGALSPNPWKVVIFLYELDLPFEMKTLDRTDPDIRNKEPLVSLTPNGRCPAIFDPNPKPEGIKVWESAAIIEYLLEQYDKQNRLSYTSFPEKFEESSWKHFQMSGQGPYFGQRSWFLHLHSEQIPSAQERYAVELRRILQVIDNHLGRTGRKWLVGDELSFVDLMFVPWNTLALMFLMGPSFAEEWQKEYPNCWDWNQRLSELDSVKRAKDFTMQAAQQNPGAAAEVNEVKD